MKKEKLLLIIEMEGIFVNQLAMVVADIHIHYKNNDPNFEKTLSYGEEEVRLK